MADCDNDQECEKIVPGTITPEPLPTPSGGGGTKDFNALDNRPSYGGVKMTGNTNIPDLSGSVSQLGTDVSGIQGVIPEAATAQNQLADKNFVNSSVATNTAYFVGTFNSVADLEAVQDPSNNDYGFVIATDSAGNTVYNRYKYNASTSAWVFEYALNNSSFTSDQWAAINSAITSGDVAKLQGLAEIKSISTGLELDENGALSEKLYTETGNNEDASMTQKAITAALANAGGGLAIELTADDYDYPTNNPTKVAAWKLPEGLYKWSTGVDVALHSLQDNGSGGTLLVTKSPTGITYLFYVNGNSVRSAIRIQMTSTSDGRDFGEYQNLFPSVINNFTSTSTYDVLSAAKGKELNDKITPNSGSGAPTTSTVGILGKTYIDTDTDTAYMCTKVDNGTYTWKQITA